MLPSPAINSLCIISSDNRRRRKFLQGIGQISFRFITELQEQFYLLCKIFTLFFINKKNIDFPSQAEYSYFCADFMLKNIVINILRL